MLKDKKFLILIGLIIFLPLFTIVLTSIMRGCQNRGSSYNLYEKNMIKAAEKYFKRNHTEPDKEGEFVRVSLDTLVSNNYIKSSSSSLKDSSCTGYVTARLNGSSVEKNKGGFVNYLVNLECQKYKTETLASLLKKDIVTSKSGLYKVGNEYIFKGDEVKNYITFHDKNYRIMGITSDGFVKMIKVDNEPVSKTWDSKYNIEVKQSYGKTIYSDSNILKSLTNDYLYDKKISKEARKHIVATDTCIGKRSINDITISKQIDCQETIPNQFISLIGVSDFALASADPDCNNITTRSCNNYNYLKNIAYETWTTNAVTENSYEVLTLNGGVIMPEIANKYMKYNIIIHIDANEKIQSGIGTEEEPYLIK